MGEAKKRLRAKPCPFCGFQYKGSMFTFNGRAERFECYDCGALGPFPGMGKGFNNPPGRAQSYYDRATLAAWNTRAANGGPQ